MNKNKFQRSVPLEKRTWPYRAFIDYLTEINFNYWSLVPALSKEKYLVRESEKNSESKRIKSVDFFHASGENARRIPVYLDEWVEKIEVFENWNRINILVALLSNFETYLSSVTEVALESNPALFFNYDFLDPTNERSSELIPKIDGVEYLKKGLYEGNRYSNLIDKIKQGLTKGEWSSRARVFYTIFPDAPESLNDNVLKLDKIRVLRNNAAHSFGRDIKEARQNRNLRKVDTYDKLSEERLMQYFKLFTDLSSSIDGYLLNNQIGAYELVYYYHRHAQKYGLNEYNGHHMVDVKKELTAMNGTTTIGKTYVQGMMKYYHNINN